MRPIHLRLTSSKIEARTYRFGAYTDDDQRTIGWALVTINDGTGELIVNSDWGDYANMWGADPKNLGAATLTDFLAGMNDPHYVVDKLVGKDGGREFSAQKTTEGLIESLMEIRRDHIERFGRKPNLRADGTGLHHPHRQYMTHAIFEELSEELRSLAADCGTGDQACALYLERMPGDVNNYLDDIWDRCCTEETWASKHLRSFIVPAIILACRAETERRFRELGDVAQVLMGALEAARTSGYRHSLPACPCAAKSNTACRGGSQFPVGTRCGYWGSLCGGTPDRDGGGSQTDEAKRGPAETRCTNLCPREWSGHWRDWHRGHGCNLDPDRGKATAAPAAGAVTP